MQKIKKLLIWILLITLGLSMTPVCAGTQEKESNTEYDLTKIMKSWQQLSDQELNDYIGNNNDLELYDFISGMSEEERKILREKDTMLNNTFTVDNEDGTLKHMPYYEWIMENGKNAAGPVMFRMSRGVVSTFTAKSGHCFYRFEDDDSGYVVRYKVTFTLDSTSNAESESNDYTVGSVIYATSGSNTNNTKLNKVTFKKKLKYMKKAATSHKVLSDGSAGEMRDGVKMYPTAITPVFVLTVNVDKPAYTYGKWSNSGFTSAGEKQQIAEGSRFNFREYDWQNRGDSTFNSNVYHSEKEDVLTSCVNILSCGFTVENPGGLGLSEGVPEVDTINVVYKHPVLNLDFYPNGGTVTEGTLNEKADNPVRKTVLYNDVYSQKYGLPLFSSLGFKRTGYKACPGAEWTTSDGSKTWDESDVTYTATDFLNFEDGTYFTSKVRGLYANWEGIVYKVTLDNQGAEFSGTEATWYRYNTYGTQTLSDGSIQKNYYYTTSSLVTPLKNGYKIVKPTKAGYLFKGYFTEKGGKGTQYVLENGSFTNQLWKQIGPHTLYAFWEKKPPEIGELVIRRNLNRDDYYSSHGDATFVFKITSEAGDDYYRIISFTAADVKEAKNGIITQETSCNLPYGKYTVEAIDVSRFENKLSSISSGSKVTDVKGRFELNSVYTSVLAIYDGSKYDWQRFSHNDLLINSLK